MAGKFDTTDIDRLRDIADIADIIGGYVNLKRGSRGDWWGKCPFHGEKTASFHVVPDRQMYYCFGCGRGGNVFNFLMDMDGVSYGEAVNMLARRYGVEIRTVGGTSSDQPSRTDRDQIYRLNEMASKYYNYLLTNVDKSEDARKAYDYLLDRGITDDIIKEYRLGWSENSWDALVTVIEKKGMPPSVGQVCGLTLKKKSGTGFVDRFRGRVMFPIMNLTGQVVGFGGRRLEGVTDKEDVAKYVNTAETPVYHKGSTLYGLNNARQAVREKNRLFLVEGYTDLLALVQAGIIETAASLGTAFTDEQARLISRFTPNVTIVYDSDTAGINAATKAAGIMVRNNLDPKVALLPTGADPDSLLREQGAESLATTLDNALSFVQFMLNTSSSGLKGIPVSGWDRSEKTVVAKSILEIIAGVGEPVQRELLLQELSEAMSIGLSALEKSMAGSRPRRTVADSPVQITEFSIKTNETAERDLMRMLISYPKLIEIISNEVTVEMFLNRDLRDLYSKIEAAYLRGEPIEVNQLPELVEAPELRAFIAQAVITSDEISVEKAREASLDCVDALRKRDFNNRILELESEIRNLGSAGKPTGEKLRELVELQRQKRMIN